MEGDGSTGSMAGRWDPAALEFSALSRVRLDLLLRELLERVGEVLNAQERLQALLDAVVSLGTDLDLRSVLSRVVTAAGRLADARYAALGVIGADRRLTEFVTYGLSEEERAAIGTLPRGHGVLGLLIDDPQPIRLKRIADHPRSYGFPPNHPPMESFLGVPIRVRDQVFGNLYLAEKQGGVDFSAEDEQVVAALAAAAAIAIENARFYALADRRRRWTQASAEITESLLGLADRRESLALIVRRAHEIAGCDVVALLLHRDDGLLVEVAEGFAADELRGLQLRGAGGLVAEVIDTGEPVIVPDFASDGRVAERGGATARLREIGQAVFVPFRAADESRGALLVGWRRDVDVPLGPDEVDLVQNFATHAALALDRVRAEQDRHLLDLLEDRDRIARDLHDHVIQRLFATGMQLQGASRLAVRPEVHERIMGAVEDLDSTIDEIRTTIFDLRREPGGTDLRSEIHDIVASAVPTLGFSPRLTIRGPARYAVSDDVQPHLLAALREGLANIARHAGAGHVEIQLAVTAIEIELRIEDNGRGLGDTNRRSGLANLARRADDFGGGCEVLPRDGGGTVLRWWVPRRRASTLSRD